VGFARSRIPSSVISFVRGCGLSAIDGPRDGARTCWRPLRAAPCLAKSVAEGGWKSTTLTSSLRLRAATGTRAGLTFRPSQARAERGRRAGARVTFTDTSKAGSILDHLPTWPHPTGPQSFTRQRSAAGFPEASVRGPITSRAARNFSAPSSSAATDTSVRPAGRSRTGS